VLERVCAGRTNPEIARELDRSENRISNVVKELLKLFGARNRVELLAVAVHCGLVNARPPCPAQSSRIDKAHEQAHNCGHDAALVSRSKTRSP
jgi:hypothetical protein